MYTQTAVLKCSTVNTLQFNVERNSKTVQQ